jgi:4-amino-4-deoxy-L-arabinose transferase-like glycosyltransferase
MFQPVNVPGAKANAVQYYNYARNLVQHGVFSADPIGTLHPIGDSFRDPGYPVFLAAWMEIFPQWSSWYAAVIFSQAVLSAATVVLWLIIGRRWMPSRWLFLAGLLMAAWPHSISLSSHLLSETLYGFLIALAMLVFALGMHKPTFRWAVISGICFTLAAFINSVLLPFATLLVICLTIRRQLPPKVALALVATVACLMTPWMLRNSMLRADQPTSGDRAFINLVQG